MRKALTGLFTAGLVAAAMTVAAGEASAISPSQCGSGYLHFYSHVNTTCWANAGSISVNLPGVYFYSTGNNAGFYTGDNELTGNRYTEYWAKNATRNIATTTIVYIHIN